MASSSELGCVYAALILADDNIEITSEKINTLLKAAKVQYEPFWPTLFAKALAGKKVLDLVGNVGSASAGVAAAPAATAEAPAAAAGGKGDAKKDDKKKEEPKKEEKKKEPEPEDEGGMDGFSLFD
jgi:large subunit ribosomal protein LP1